jgi:hypothetical protein
MIMIILGLSSSGGEFYSLLQVITGWIIPLKPSLEKGNLREKNLPKIPFNKGGF